MEWRLDTRAGRQSCQHYACLVRKNDRYPSAPTIRAFDPIRSSTTAMSYPAPSDGVYGFITSILLRPFPENGINIKGFVIVFCFHPYWGISVHTPHTPAY